MEGLSVMLRDWVFIPQATESDSVVRKSVYILIWILEDNWEQLNKTLDRGVNGRKRTRQKFFAAGYFTIPNYLLPTSL